MVPDSIARRLPANVRLGVGTVYVHTERGRGLVDRCSRWRHADRYHDAGVVACGVSMVVALVTLAWVGLSVARSPPEPTAAQKPTNLVAVPGVNEFLPLSAALYILLGLLVAAAAHELAHAVAMRAEGVAVDEIGVAFLGCIPVAAYVLPEEADFEAASVRSRARVFAAGVLANLLVFAACSVAFLLPGAGSPVTAFLAYFGAVFGGSAASAADVAALGPLTNVLFWTWFFDLNLAFVNVLPVATLDGGKLVGLLPELRVSADGPGPAGRSAPADVSVDAAIESPPTRDSDARRASRLLVGATTLATGGAFVLAVFGPVFLR